MRRTGKDGLGPNRHIARVVIVEPVLGPKGVRVQFTVMKQDAELTAVADFVFLNHRRTRITDDVAARVATVFDEAVAEY
jgi:hypothetical protein